MVRHLNDKSKNGKQVIVRNNGHAWEICKSEKYWGNMEKGKSEKYLKKHGKREK